MVGGNLLATAIGLVGTLVQVRFVGPEDLGYLRQFGILTSYAFCLHLGLFDALQRLYPLYMGQGRRGQAVAVAEVCQSWNAGVSVLVSGAFLLLALVAFGHGNWRAGLAWLVQAVAITGFIYGNYLSATFRSGHDFVTVAKASVVGTVANLATLPCFLFFPYVALVLRNSVGSPVNLVYLHQRRPLRLRWRFNWREWLAIARQGIEIFTASYGMVTGWSALEATFIVKLLGAVSLGLWTISITLFHMVSSVALAIAAVYVPRVIEEYGRTSSVRACLRLCWRPMLWGIIPVSLIGLGACVVLPVVVPWLMPKYTAAIPTMCLVMFYLPLIILEMPYQLVVARGHWFWMNVISYGSLGCFAVFALLAVRWGLGLNGVVGASLLGRGVRLAMIYLFIGAELQRERLADGVGRWASPFSVGAGRTALAGASFRREEPEAIGTVAPKCGKRQATLNMLERIIIPGGYGRTCNQLFQITRWIPTAINREIPLYFPGFRPYAKLFAGTQGGGMPRFPRGAPALPGSNAMLAWLLCGLNRARPNLLSACLPLVEALPGNVAFDLHDSGRDGPTTTAMVLEQESIFAGRTLWIKGWLYRDPEGVRTHAAAIRDFFAPVPPMAQRIAAFVQSVRSGDQVLVGLHLRRGDYRAWADGRYFYEDAAFCGVMRQMRVALPGRRVRFLLVSDEAIDRTHFQEFDIVVGPGDAMGDLYSLAACDYLIGPPATYSAWASWYGDVPLHYLEDPTQPVQLGHFKSAH